MTTVKSQTGDSTVRARVPKTWLQLHGTFCSLAMLTNSIKQAAPLKWLTRLPSDGGNTTRSLSSCRPCWTPERHSGRWLRGVTCPPATPIPPPQAPRGNKEARCHKQWTINPWSGRKQLGSKSNFSPFCLVLGGGRGRGDCGCFIFKTATTI